MTTIDSTRLAEVTARDIGHGAHFSLDDGLCVMEAVAYVAGEPWSDHPKCACPVLGAFMRAWNDGLPTDEDRTRLLRPWEDGRECGYESHDPEGASVDSGGREPVHRHELEVRRPVHR